MQIKLLVIVIIGLLSIRGGCSKKTAGGDNPPPPVIQPPAVNQVDYWLTKGDQSILLQKQSTILSFGTTTNSYPGITVDTTQRYQTVDGFGYTLTSGSATLINSLGASKSALLQELFGNG